jgi:hypothetical protein
MRWLTSVGMIGWLLLGCRGEDATPAPEVTKQAPPPPAPPVDAAPDAFVVKPASPVTLSCPPGSTQVIDTYTKALERRLLTEVVCEADGKRNGPYKKFDHDGELTEEGTYVNDRLDGAWTDYHPGGTKHQVGQYRQGAMTGVWTSYHSNGKVNCKSTRDDATTLELHCFDDRGRRTVRGKSPGGVDDGMWDWFEDGKPASSILYKNGTEMKWWIYPGGKKTAVSKETYEAHIYKKP